ncbi:ATP-binding cassette domain-containing protein [Humibacter ginsenosidimutans]|uniref:ATP-binding cassette domain-containing protein n=1 Tax=Humibacter ginsenosidimutans TaxID=2599293 RepID=A0A5B8M2J6_9MICO|nr:ATP-binding cassette domain-containing protein [Humibacter ginsenosidimutans]QDZ15028.1 ATP-binding cassette domain-containing protein [Humibacter ginsenosidimutans]
MPENTRAVDVVGLAKTYRGPHRAPVHALRGLTFQVPAGIVFAMLGPNGAGKSTTTKILTTLSRPTGGTAFIDGIDVVRRPAEVRQHIGYVSQGASTDPLLTGTENLMLAGRLRGMPASDVRSRATALLTEFGLADTADRPVGKFSGGMRRRLDVAAALVHAPRVLFLDEPTTGLDPEARAAMWGEIRRLSAERAITVILTTHYLDEADRLADDVMIIDHGTRVVGGSPDELKASLGGDTVRVSLVEPDVERVRRAAASVPGLRDVVVETQGTAGQLVARTGDASAAVAPTIAALEAAGVVFGAVSASRPSLDDVYLHYAGRSFERADASASEAAAASDPDHTGPTQKGEAA